MKESVRNIVHFLLAVGIAVGFGFWSARHYRYKGPETVIKIERDTLYIYDTITAYKPVPFNVYVVDTLYVPVPVKGETDTVWVQLPREAKVYQDSTYRAVVSGYRPSLDSISVYRREVKVIEMNVVRLPAPRFSWGVQTGVGVVADGKVVPYLGIGVQYRLGELQIRNK